MSEAVAAYNPDLNSHEENQLYCDELRLLSINEARQILGIRHSTLKSLVLNGDIEHLIINGTVRIPYIALKKFVLEKSSYREQQKNSNLETDINSIISKSKL